ncbi:MAG: class I SAM-dependent methyltransferase [bacterium]
MRIKKLLSIPQIYTLWQKLVGDYKLRKIYCSDYVKAKEGDRILDIGCGPANMVSYLPKDIDYVGFDDSSLYIENAKKKFPNQKNYSFFCQRVNFAQDFEEKFDIVMANAILHHLDDSESEKLISFASKNLKQGGRFVTFDGCYTENQSVVKKWLLKNDRGQFVRTKEDYFKLFSKYFSNIKVSIREDLCNIPYTIIIFECCLN